MKTKLSVLLASVVPFLIITLVATILLRTFIHDGIPETHDGNSHLARIANFYIAIHDHHFPPRWAPNLNYQFGYPVFNFLYYLPYIPAIMLYSASFSLEWAFKIVTFSLFVWGASFLYLFLRKYLSNSSSLAGALLFLTAPPQLLQVFVRGDIGETTGLAMLPFCLWSLQKLITALTKRESSYIWWLLSSLGIFLLLLSHNVVLLFGGPMLFGFVVFTFWSQKGNFLSQAFLKVFSVFVIGLGLGAFYLIPAFGESKYITLSKVDQTKEFMYHFPTKSKPFFL